MAKGRVHKHIDRLVQWMDNVSCHVAYVCGNKSIIQYNPEQKILI